jgi:cobalamin biosynthesis Mg chelatase CobN
MLALLALALFPVAAQAECSTSSCLNYEVEVPTIESEGPTKSGSGKSPTHHKSSNNAKAEGSADSESSGGAGTEEPETESGSSEGGHKKKGSSSQEEEGKSSTAGGGNGDSGNKPSGGANSGGSESSIGESKDLGGTQQGKNVSESSGGSSPVVPILIAVVVLAAISIGVVLYRQRKSDQDGTDGCVSSSNAS